MTEIVENFGSEYATFAVYGEFATFLRKFRTISTEEQQKLLSKIKYETVSDILKKAYKNLESLKTRDELDDFLNQNEKNIQIGN